MNDPVKRPWFSIGRLFDVAALAIVAFVLWKIFIAPRSFAPAGSQPAPHVVYDRLDGGQFRLTDQHGRLVFLDFYASWCEPCRVEIPLVQRWAREHPGVEVVPIDVGEPRPAVAHFAQKFKLGNVAMDPSASAQGYFSIQGFPTVVVVDRNGDIRAHWPGLNLAIGLAMSNAIKKLQ